MVATVATLLTTVTILVAKVTTLLATVTTLFATVLLWLLHCYFGCYIVTLVATLLLWLLKLLLWLLQCHFGCYSATLVARVGNRAQKADVEQNGVKAALILIFLQFKSEADKMAARLTSLKVGCCFLVRWSFVCRAHPVVCPLLLLLLHLVSSDRFDYRTFRGCWLGN